MFHEFNGTIFKQFTKPNSTRNKNLPFFQTELENSKQSLKFFLFCLWMTKTLWVHLLYLFLYSNCQKKKFDKVLAFLYYITDYYLLTTSSALRMFGMKLKKWKVFYIYSPIIYIKYVMTSASIKPLTPMSLHFSILQHFFGSPFLCVLL